MATKNDAWDIFIDETVGGVTREKYLDTIYFRSGMTSEEVTKTLVSHDGFSAGIKARPAEER